MINALQRGAAAAVIATSMLPLGYSAGAQQMPPAAPVVEPSPATLTEPQRQEIEAVVRRYLMENPEILLEMQQALDAKQKEEQRIAHIEAIRGAKAEIFNAAYDGSVGNPDGTVTMVEFYDYNCGYCKRAQEDMQAMIAADPELRFVLKEFPILGPDSQKASTVSMAFRTLYPELHGEFHNLLLSAPGRAGEASAIKVALQLGADEQKLREEMKNPAITEAFAKTYELANKLSITGTPSYVVGNEVVFGALGQDVLREKIAAAKECIATSTC